MNTAILKQLSKNPAIKNKTHKNHLCCVSSGTALSGDEDRKAEDADSSLFLSITLTSSSYAALVCSYSEGRCFSDVSPFSTINLFVLVHKTN